MGGLNKQQEEASLHITGAVAYCLGDWTVRHLSGIENSLARLAKQKITEIDLTRLGRMDTGGAWLLLQLRKHLEQHGTRVNLKGVDAEAQGMLDLVGGTGMSSDNVPIPYRAGALEGLGRKSMDSALNSLGMLAFIGEIAHVALRQVLRPVHIRWASIAYELGEAGYKALAIVGLLAFLLGIVIAYQGGVQLRLYGANIFVADLVGLSMVRELSPIITSIIVAGRTGSAYTAQIGTMQVTEEIDALRSMGIQPMEILVLPKLLALLIALPLLTVYADIMGVLGGMVMANLQLDIAFSTFFDRLGVALTLNSYLVGVGKAPVFAVIIAIIGCYQGFQVSGSAESVGRRTTISVVQAILAVIVIDAAFSIAFSYLDI
jgi:phospholipid/cholesterol/gamma-HCH transport system permease protein